MTNLHRSRVLGTAEFYGRCAVAAIRLAAALPPQTGRPDSKHRRSLIAAAVTHARTAAHAAFLALPELRADV